MYDICIGSSPRQAAAPVILTVDDRAAADSIVGALNETRSSWVDARGLHAFSREVDRGPGGGEAEGAEVKEPAIEPEATEEPEAGDNDDEGSGET